MSDSTPASRLHLSRRYFVTGRPGHNDRPPLPAGHPLTWGLITSGTCLDASPYPFPVFLS